MRWIIVLWKRTLRDPLQWFIWLMIPLFAVICIASSRMESGALRVAVACEDPSQAVYQELLERLDSRVVRFVPCQTKQEAVRLVSDAKADAAWIFSENLEDGIRKAVKKAAFAQETYAEETDEAANENMPPVLIYERFDNVFLRLSREKLFTLIYPLLSFDVYKDYIREELGFSTVTDETLRENYGLSATDGQIIVFETLSGSSLDEALEVNYLLSPVRGLLSLLVVLCGFSASLQLMKDKENGLFTWLDKKPGMWIQYAYYLVYMIPAALLMEASLFVAGLTFSAQHEILYLLLFMLSLIPFCDLWRRLLAKADLLCICIPLVLLGMLVFSPVFLDIGPFKPLQYLLPTYFYLHGAGAGAYLTQFLIQTAVYSIADIVCCRIS